MNVYSSVICFFTTMKLQLTISNSIFNETLKMTYENKNAIEIILTYLKSRHLMRAIQNFYNQQNYTKSNRKKCIIINQTLQGMMDEKT